jgi:hypothetical protein
LRARKGSENTKAAYRVAAFQTFLSGRISTFGDINQPCGPSTSGSDVTTIRNLGSWRNETIHVTSFVIGCLFLPSNRFMRLPDSG